MVGTASRHARDLSEALADHIDAGRDIVVVEPSDLAMLRADYGKLVEQETAELLSDHSYEIMEYVYGLLQHLDSDIDPSAYLESADGAASIAYHSHCQQRTLGLEAYTTSVLEELGFEIMTSNVECCGMAGSFGYKSQFFDLSLDVAEPLYDQFSTSDSKERTLVASGISCSEQLEAGFDRTVIHPIELIDPDCAPLEREPSSGIDQ
jgi:Fe-S oxidoreductase